MKVTFAQFNVEHDDKSYGVQFSVQYVTDNQTFTTVTIYAVNEGIKRIVDNFSTKGRQVISPSNAKKFLRKALIAEGTIKPPRPPEDPKPKEYKPGDVVSYGGRLFEESSDRIVDFKYTPGAEINDQRKEAPGILKKIRDYFS